jgi:hypothetical protein
VDIIGVVTRVFVAPPIDSRLVDMTNYLVHKTSRRERASLDLFLFRRDKVANFIFPARAKWKLKIEPINYGVREIGV